MHTVGIFFSVAVVVVVALWLDPLVWLIPSYRRLKNAEAAIANLQISGIGHGPLSKTKGGGLGACVRSGS